MNAAGWAAVLASAVAVAAALPSPPPEVEDGRARRGPEGTRGDRGRRPRLLVAASVGAGTFVLVGHLAGGLAAAVTTALAWHLTGRLETPQARRRRERLVADLPHVVDLMAACLSVGLAPAAAARQIAAAVTGPVAEELDAVRARLDFGVDPATAWRDLGRHPQLGALGRCIARSVESGASVAHAMDRLADDLRRDSRAAVEARARTVGVRAAVPLGICLLPAFLLVGVVPLVVGSVPLVLGR